MRVNRFWRSSRFGLLALLLLLFALTVASAQALAPRDFWQYQALAAVEQAAILVTLMSATLALGFLVIDWAWG